MKSRSLQVFAVVLSLVAVAAASLQTYAGFSRISVNAERVTQALVVLNKISELHNTLYEAESAVRGYALSHDPKFLEPYKHAIGAMPTQFGELRRLTADSPSQQTRLNDLAKVVETKKAQLAQAIATGVENTEVFRTGRELMSQIRGLLSAMMGEEARSHALRSAELEETTRAAILSLLGSVALSVLVIISVTLMIIREASRRIRTERQLQELNTELENRVAAKTNEFAKVNELLQAIIRSSPLGIVALNEHKVITSWNRRAEEIFGLSAASMLGTPWTLLTDVGGTNFKALFARRRRRTHARHQRHASAPRRPTPSHRPCGSPALSAPEPPARRRPRLRGRNRTADGRRSAPAGPEDGGGRPADGWARPRLQQPARGDHRQPQPGARGQRGRGELERVDAARKAELERIDAARKAELERVDAARKAALRGAELTRQILVFARQQSLQPADIKLNELVERTAALLRRSLGQSITVETRIAPDLWMAHADPSQVEATLVNLALNARDAMAEGAT